MWGIFREKLETEEKYELPYQFWGSKLWGAAVACMGFSRCLKIELSAQADSFTGYFSKNSFNKVVITADNNY